MERIKRCQIAENCTKKNSKGHAKYHNQTATIFVHVDASPRIWPVVAWHRSSTAESRCNLIEDWR